MAISSYGVQLMHKSGNTYSPLIDIKSFPDIGGAPETLETTTTSDASTTYILGIQQLDAMTFEANYTEDDYKTVKDLVNVEQTFAVFFGSDKDTSGDFTGSAGKYYFKGFIDVAISGGGVNEVVNMSITIAPTTEIGTDEL